jgi:hypothetical protein
MDSSIVKGTKGYYTVWMTNVPILIPVTVTDVKGEWFYVLADDLAPHFLGLETTHRGLWLRWNGEGCDDPNWVRGKA